MILDGKWGDMIKDFLWRAVARYEKVNITVENNKYE